MNKTMLTFPAGFLWGAATSSHQAEGGNRNDWTEWEAKNAQKLAQKAEQAFSRKVPDWQRIAPEASDPHNYVSGAAAHHYDRYREDVAIMKSLGFTAYRFSIEWSRVQPRRGEFDEKEIAHYRAVIEELKRSGIEPLVTLWHRSNPLWLAENGGWENRDNVRHYLAYVQRIAKEFGSQVAYWMPLNEPLLYIISSSLGGQYPPQTKSLFRAEKVFRNFVSAFNRAAKIIHEQNPQSQVGTADAAMYLEAYKNRWYNRLTVRLMDWYCNRRFTAAVLQHADFLGVQYYSRGLVGWEWAQWYPSPKQIIEGSDGSKATVQRILQDTKPLESSPTPTKYPLSDMGWEIYPQGLYAFLVGLQKYRKPVLVTENGIADALDAQRTNFIRQHVAQIHRAISHGTDVRGYLHWSLLDNLEWDKGFWPKFGLIAVDRHTGQRTIRHSARDYSAIIQQNGLDMPNTTN